MSRIIEKLKDFTINISTSHTFITCDSYTEWKNVLDELYDADVVWFSRHEDGYSEDDLEGLTSKEAELYLKNKRYGKPCISIEWKVQYGHGKRISVNHMTATRLSDAEIGSMNNVIKASELVDCEFKLNDIKAGYLVITRDEDIHVVTELEDGKLIFVDGTGRGLYTYNYNGFDYIGFCNGIEDFDIMEVYGLMHHLTPDCLKTPYVKEYMKHNRKLLYSRQEDKNLSDVNKFVQMNLDAGMVYKRSPLKGDKR